MASHTDRFFVDIRQRIRIIGSSLAECHDFRNSRMIGVDIGEFGCPYRMLVALSGTFLLPISVNFLPKLSIFKVYVASVILQFQHYVGCTLE